MNLTPVIAYKLTSGNRRQLIRGIDISGLRARSLKGITGTGLTSNVRSFLRVGVPVSVVCPDLLFGEADVKRRRGGHRQLPSIASPMSRR